MIAQFINQIWELDLTPTGKLVLINLCDHANEEKEQMAWPSLKCIAEETGLADSTIRLALDELWKREIIHVAGSIRPKNGGRRVKVWRINLTNRRSSAVQPPTSGFDDRRESAMEPVTVQPVNQPVKRGEQSSPDTTHKNGNGKNLLHSLPDEYHNDPVIVWGLTKSNNPGIKNSGNPLAYILSNYDFISRQFDKYQCKAQETRMKNDISRREHNKQTPRRARGANAYFISGNGNKVPYRKEDDIDDLAYTKQDLIFFRDSQRRRNDQGEVEE